MQINKSFKIFTILRLILFFILLVTHINYSYSNVRKDYINKYKKICIKESKRTGIPASIKMAQAILESGSGTSKLSKKSNNHFGIKCHKDWKKKGVKHDDDEKDECFRKYKNPNKSFEDHSEFLSKNRYKFLYNYDKHDYVSWAKGLKKAGYATNPNYPKLLIKIIEEEKLYELDGGKSLAFKTPNSKKETLEESDFTDFEQNERESEGYNEIIKEEIVVEPMNTNLDAKTVETKVYKSIENSDNPKITSIPIKETIEDDNIRIIPKVEKNVQKPLSSEIKKKLEVILILDKLTKKRIKKNNKVKYISALKGETFKLIASAYNIPINNIYLFNDLEINSREPFENEIIYLEPKRTKSILKEVHRVDQNENLWSISQTLAIKLNSLKRKNLISKKNNKVSVGQTLYLTKKKDSKLDLDTNKSSDLY